MTWQDVLLAVNQSILKDSRMDYCCPYSRHEGVFQHSI